MFNYSLGESIQQPTSNNQNCWKFLWFFSRTSLTERFSTFGSEIKVKTVHFPFIVLCENLKVDMEPQTPPFPFTFFFAKKITFISNTRTNGLMSQAWTQFSYYIHLELRWLLFMKKKLEIAFWVYFLAFTIWLNSGYSSILCSQFRKIIYHHVSWFEANFNLFNVLMTRVWIFGIHSMDYITSNSKNGKLIQSIKFSIFTK